ncbi:hypothetical protein IB49_09035 [Geobacillus sp. LC300]|nr:hypothetical protein IB49_09035 [Geobacillus sp. LC300]
MILMYIMENGIVLLFKWQKEILSQEDMASPRITIVPAKRMQHFMLAITNTRLWKQKFRLTINGERGTEESLSFIYTRMIN